VFWQKRVTVPYAKITNIDVTQGPLQRSFDIGTIRVQTAGAGGAQGEQAEMVLWGLRDLEEVQNQIMRRVDGCAASGV
jgi:membrane protein YdbS with pleckstrin-like domain